MPARGSNMNTRLAFCLFVTLIPLASVRAQESATTLTLTQATGAALAQGADSRIMQKNLDIAREQYRLSVSQSSFSLSGSVGESATYGFGDGTLLSTNSLASGFSQTPQAGVSLVAPLTSIGLTISPYSPANPLAADLSQISSLFSPGPPAPSPGATGSVGLNVAQTLWNGYPGGPAAAAVQKGMLALRGTELSTGSGRQNIVSAVTQAYFVMLSAQRNLSVKAEIREQQKSLLAQLGTLEGLKQATAVDLRTAQINAQSAEIDVQSAENDLRIARIRLAQLIGWPRETEFTVADQDDPQLPVGTLEEAIAEAMKNRTEIQQIELNRQASAIDRSMIQGQRTPTVSVTAGVTLIHDWSLLNTAGQGSLGLKVGMPILDSGSTAHQLEANRIQSDAYIVREDQLRASIATDVEEAYELVQITAQRLQVARLSGEKFDLKFTLKKTEAQYGTATNQDLLDASIDAANARSALVRAQRDVQLAILQLRNAMGD
jgi:outer membrane protein TolC